MVNPLLERAPPKVFAERGQIIEKKEKLELFPRLSEVVGGDLRRLAGESMPAAWRQSPVAIRLAFGWADTAHDIPVLEGQAAVDVPAVCQRCLEAFELVLETDLRLLFSGPGRSVDESLDYEVWELEEPLLRPLDVIDEALVMAMPLAAMHVSEEDCGPLAGKAKVEEEAQVRPFADLRAQMQTRDRD
ncbi:MAG TPA: YceD family protein [Woeseiaceae bacterium]|nr:YceD family protein [Woeseiaceae bacterium]